MAVTGELFIGSSRFATTDTFLASNPATGLALQPAFSEAGPAEVERACALAAASADTFRGSGSEQRALFLEAIGARVLGLGDELLERAQAETGLPMARLTGERGRTVGQLRLFADELRKGEWARLRIDPALPDRKPAPRPDLRLHKVAMGPVAVFGASNFPLAFSVAGGDTAAALAAGCPVIVKGHHSHPGTGELVAQAITAAAEECGLPDGVFSLLNGTAHALGAALVSHGHIRAVGFTGSRAGGLALLQLANARPVPIPVYAEMSSVNPVVLLPHALAARAELLGREFVGSLTLGAGQFCTNPGLVLAIGGDALERFVAAAGAGVQQAPPAVMLSSAIHRAYELGVAKLGQQPGVRRVAQAPAAAGSNCGSAALFRTDAAALLGNQAISHEVFGASSLVIACKDEAQLLRVLEGLEGQLTVTLHMDTADESLAARLLPTLERKAGRLVANAWPTGVEVTHAMVHGGPFPATADGRSTSVGTLAIERFLRPVCYQDFPDGLLPAALRRSAAPVGPHRLDGVVRSN
jgi:2,5-dioxopentanoate dehydrogenase